MLLASIVCLGLALAACGGTEDPDSCVLGEPSPICVGDNCLGAAWSSDLGSFGDVCADGTQCLSGYCAYDNLTDQQYCTELCEPGTLPCPGDVQCLAAGAQHLCAPPIPSCGA